MQIFINTIIDEHGLKDWAMIELQGDLESKKQEPLAGKLVGDLHYTKDGVPFMIIGHHILYGKIQKLEKPFAVLETVPDLKGKDGRTEYVVKALIHNKLCFTDRPKPLVSNNITSKVNK